PSGSTAAQRVVSALIQQLQAPGDDNQMIRFTAALSLCRLHANGIDLSSSSPNCKQALQSAVHDPVKHNRYAAAYAFDCLARMEHKNDPKKARERVFNYECPYTNEYSLW